MKNLREKGPIEKGITIRDIITKGETNKIEFKSSLLWDVDKKNKNKEMGYIIAKTISAFMNSDGGKLLIGVDDNGDISGLEPDFSIDY